MGLTTDNSGAVLVGRAASRESIMQTRKITVVRPFYFNRLVQKKGQIVELPSLFAGEMIAAQKAAPYDEPAAEPAPAATRETGTGAEKKERTHAGK